MGRDEAEPVQSVPFAMTCPCGLRTDGLRQERAKRVICAQCGTAHFILPANPYPTSERTYFQTNSQVGGTNDTPKTKPRIDPSSAKIDRAASTESSTDLDAPFIDGDDEATEPEMDLVEAAWSTGGDQTSYDDDLEDDDDYELADSDAEIELDYQPVRPKRRPKRASSSSGAARKNAEVSAKSAVRSETTRPTRLELPSANDERRRQRLRIIAITGLIIVVAGAAITWTVRSRKLERAEVAMREGRDIGKAALKVRDFVTAREKLGEAVEAMELLGIEEQTKAETRHLWLQAEAGFGLLDSIDVVEIAMAAEEASAASKAGDKDADNSDWQRQFRVQYFDRWLCIQLEPAEIVAGDDDMGQRIVFPALPAIHLVGVDSVLAEQTAGRLWFAGPLKSCQRDPLNDSVWLIGFDSSRVIACDGTESLVLPMLSKEQQKDAMLAQSAETSSLKGQGVDAPEGSGDE